MSKLPKHLTTSLDHLDQEIQDAKKSLSSKQTQPENQATIPEENVAYIHNPDWIMHVTTLIQRENSKEEFALKQDFRLKLNSIFEHIARTPTINTPNTDTLSSELSSIVSEALAPQTTGHLDDKKDPKHPSDTIRITLDNEMLVCNFGLSIAKQSKIDTIDPKLWSIHCRIEADIFLAHKDIDATWQWTQDDGLMIHIDARWSPTT